MRQTHTGSSGRLLAALAAAVLFLMMQAPIVQAISDAEKGFLSLYFTEEELHVISATRSLQSIARVAENIEVVTARDIELMNAHTLADVLNTVNGASVGFHGRFGAAATADIQGATLTRVTILMNGVPLNSLGTSIADAGFYPVQDIERIEIVKGPASAAWGSALGGVVNVITRGPGSKPFQGSASLDYGTGNSADYRAAVSGRAGNLGYYLSGSGLRTDGLTEGFDNDAGYLGARLEYALAERTDLSFDFFYGDQAMGDGAYPADDVLYGYDTKALVSRLSVASALGRDGRANLSLWTTSFDYGAFARLISDDSELFNSASKEKRSGASLSYVWSRGVQDLVLGADYSRGTRTDSELPGVEPEQKQWAVFANDSITLGRLTITPGLRYDDISISENFLSPSLGMTYALSQDTLLRAAVARGFRSPTLTETSATNELYLFRANPELTPETVWSYQAGFEANVSDVVWLKVSGFQHEVEDVITDMQFDDDWWTRVNGGAQRRRGIEIAARTKPFFHVTLAGAAFFMKTEDLETHEDALDVPRRVVDLSLKYDDGRSVRALLQGRSYYAVEPEGYNEDFGGFICDLNLAKKFAVTAGTSLEAFLSVHNLFNGDQYWADFFKNPGRWVEGGVRVSF